MIKNLSTQNLFSDLWPMSTISVFQGHVGDSCFILSETQGNLLLYHISPTRQALQSGDHLKGFDEQILFSALCPLSPSLSRCHCPTPCWPKLGPVCTRQAFYQDASSPAFPTFSLSFPRSARCPQLTLSEGWI